MDNYHSDKSKALTPKASAYTFAGGSKSSNKARKDKKIKQQKNNQNPKPAIKVNATKLINKKKKKKDVSKIMCYNCKKKDTIQLTV